MVMVMEDLGVAEDPPNMRNRSSTFRYGGFAYLADRSATVIYVGGEGDIARYTGGGDGVGDGAGEDIGEHRGEHADRGDGKDLDENLDEGLYVCFWHSSRRCRCS